MIRAGDETRAAERIARLVGRYAERFDPAGRAEFYGSVAAKVGRMHADELAFTMGDDVPSQKKLPTRAARKDSSRRRA